MSIQAIASVSIVEKKQANPAEITARLNDLFKHSQTTPETITPISPGLKGRYVSFFLAMRQ